LASKRDVRLSSLLETSPIKFSDSFNRLRPKKLSTEGKLGNLFSKPFRSKKMKGKTNCKKMLKK
jgi:hypothetical protein